MEKKFNEEEWQICLKVLNFLKEDPFNNPDNQTLKNLITSIYKKAKKTNRDESFKAASIKNNELIVKTTIVSNAKNKTTSFVHIPEHNETINDLLIARKCYCCANTFTKLHFFYHKLCPDCASLNYNQRTKTYNFSNYNVIITGGRVKIGYATVLTFLQSGANVIFTTRFPALALEQLKQEKDYNDWKNRLTIYGLDLRSIKAVNEFLEFCSQTLKSVDILINNAAQTIKYPLEYYSPLIE